MKESIKGFLGWLLLFLQLAILFPQISNFVRGNAGGRFNIGEPANITECVSINVFGFLKTC